MASGVYIWSQTGATNATADSTVNWQEGQAPSTVNDSARNMMASIAKWRDDIAGSISTGGTSVNYTLSTFQGFDTLAHLDGKIIAFTPHTTNTGSQAFLNVDGLGAKTIRLGNGIDVPAGTLIQRTPYEAVYNNSDGIFYLKNFFNLPWMIPIGSSIEYWGGTAPSSSYVLPFGQAISRATYSTLFSLLGTTYGAGDGSTTFNLPDLRGRVTACTDNMGGSDSARLASGSLAGVRFSLGGAGGESGHTLAASEIPSITSISAGVSVSVTSSRTDIVVCDQDTSTPGLNAGGNFIRAWSTAANQSRTGISSTGVTATINTSSNNTGGGSHNIMQPTILCNRIMRII